MARKAVQKPTPGSESMLQRIPPQIFGEKVLRLLGLQELRCSDVAISSDPILREHWWVGHKTLKKRPVLLDVCLRYAVDPMDMLTVSSEKQVRWMQSRQVVTPFLNVDAEWIGAKSLDNLITLVETLGVHLVSLKISRLNHPAKCLGYMRSVSRLRSLQHLQLHSDETNDPDSISRIYTYCYDILYKNTQLVELYLEDAIAKYFARNLHCCKSLRHLHFNCVNNSSVLLSSRTVMKQLDTCSLYNCLVSSWQLEEFFLTATPNIRSISLFHTDWITDACVFAIAQSCPNLEELDISSDVGHGAITDNAILLLTQRCRSINTLQCENQPYITELSLGGLLHND